MRRSARLSAGVVGRLVREPSIVITDIEQDTDIHEQHRSPSPPAASTPIGVRFPARPRLASWPATGRSRDQLLDRLTQAPFLLASAGSQKQRRRGLAALLDWLDEQPGDSWQDRWLASGADTAGANRAATPNSQNARLSCMAPGHGSPTSAKRPDGWPRPERSARNTPSCRRTGPRSGPGRRPSRVGAPEGWWDEPSSSCVVLVQLRRHPP